MQLKYTHLHAHAHFCSSVGHMTSSELPSDVSKGLWKLNFIDKVADDGKQRTFLVGSGHQWKLSLFPLLSYISLTVSVTTLQTTKAQNLPKHLS